MTTMDERGMRLYPGDIVDCQGLHITISYIHTQEWYEECGYIVEFEGTDGEWRVWKQAYDGGDVRRVSPQRSSAGTLTKEDIKAVIATAITIKDDSMVEYWNDMLDDMLAAEELIGGKFVLGYCITCKNWVLRELGDATEEAELVGNFMCASCIVDKLGPSDPQSGPNSCDCGREYYDDNYDDDDWDDDWDDDNDWDDGYYTNMHCDSTGLCIGDSCPRYFNCQV